MCGIAGIVSSSPRSANREDTLRLTASLRHRGPDASGFWFSTDERCALGHTRLAILDVSEGGAQPMRSACGRFTVVFNGEIYNFIELREELLGCGRTFQSESDTEVLLHAYCQWGEDCLRRFNGMFAFAIWDQTEGTLFLARDRFGVKPLHYCIHQSRFVFASELKAFRTLPDFSVRMDPEMRERVLLDPFSVESTGRTLLENVHQIPAGHFAWYRDDRIALKKWWSLADAMKCVPEKFSEQVILWKEAFFDSLKLRLRSDVPVGTSLSGGFDSSAILCGLAHLIKDGRGGRYAEALQEAFVACFPGADNDETPEAQSVLAHSGVQGHLFDIGGEDPAETVEDVLMAFEGIYFHLPTAVGRIYEEQRRSGIVVSLDGHGCDEIMGGYLGERISLLRDAPPFFSHPIQNFERITRHLDLTRKELDLPGQTFYVEAARQIYSNLPSLQWLRAIRASHGFKPGFSKVRSKLPVFPPDPAWDLASDTERTFSRMTQQTILPTLLRNFDRMSMAHGVEVRMPFLDWNLVALTFSLPTGSKISNGQSKWIGREALKGILPEEIRTSRKKVGFSSPFGIWMNGNLGKWAESVSADAPQDHDLIDTSHLKSYISTRNRAKSWGSDNQTLRAWLCVNFLWFERKFASYS